MPCTDHTFAEERTPDGYLLLGSCLSCGLSALDAMAVVKRERDAALEDARAARRERDEAIRTREEQDTEAQRRAVQYCREKRQAERERDEAAG